jgi:hypothetical protein
MNKNTKLIMAITAVLVVVVAVFAFLNRENIASKKEAQESGVFFIHSGGEEFTVTMEDIEALSPFTIVANYKKSGQAASNRTFQGVSLKAVVERMGVDYSRYASVSFLAADGYASALSIAEAMDDGNCYIVIAEENKPLGTRESGGSGPFMMILAQDQFSQRWCKFLLEVNLQ